MSHPNRGRREELHTTPTEAGASDDNAKSTVAACEKLLAGIRSDLAVLKWTSGASLVIGVAVVIKLFPHA